MSFWPELVDAAVLGAGRSAPPAPAQAIADLGPAPKGPDDPGWRDGTGLLRWAAVASRSRRAGYLPAASAEQRAPEPAAADWRPTVRPAASQRLSALLSDGQTELVSEWLRLLASTGRRPPDALLPPLLDLATSDQEIRRVLAPALGPLAAWLAAANPVWAWATTARPVRQPDRQDESGQPDEESVRAAWRRTWTTGSHRTRRELLDWVRRIDPEAGRDLVAATWSGDSARDRAAFTAGLVTGLNPADEPLLDQALADRSGEVSRAAASLLGRLPGSAYATRVSRRAASAVQVRATAAGPRLEVAPPADGDAELAADGVDASSPRGIGRQAWLLQQIVAAPPARWWADHTGLPPGHLLDLAASTDWAASLQAGWADAAMRDAHLPWIGAFLDLPAGRLERMGDGMASSLFCALTDADRDGWLAARPDSPLFSAAELVPGPWSAELSATASDLIAALATADPGRSPQAYRLFRVAALRLDPPVPLDLDPAQVHPRLADRWAELTSTLSVRAAMRRELAEEPAP